MRVGFLFPGQGAQYVGMGKFFYDNFPQARSLFEKASQILNKDMSKLCFESSLEELTSIVNCQVSIFLVSSVSLTIFREYFKIEPQFCAGLSLGEYTSLFACGILDFEQTLKLVEKRALFMEQSSLNTKGGMISVIGLSLEVIEEICRQKGLEIANINSPQQVVVSGAYDKILESEKDFKERGALKTVILKVSGAFHSSLMQEAEQNLRTYLENIEFKTPCYGFISNVKGASAQEPQEIKELLIKQMTGVVNWKGCCEYMISKGIDTFIEFAPGKVLRGLMKKINSSSVVYNFDNEKDFQQLKEIFK